MELIKVLALCHHHRFVESHPVFHQISKQGKAFLGEDDEQLHHLPGFPAAILLIEFHWQIKMVQIDDGANPLADKFLQHGTIEPNSLLVSLPGLKILHQPCPLNGGTHGIQPDFLHQSYVAHIIVIKIRGDIRPYAVPESFRLRIIPIVEYIAVQLMEASFCLRAGGSSPPPKPLGEFMLHGTHPFLPRFSYISTISCAISRTARAVMK